MLKNLKYFFQIIKNMKIIFKKPKKCKVILYDRNTGYGLRHYLNYDEIFILDTRKESINILILIRSLIKHGFRWSYKKYLYNIIEFVNPSVIISNIDNNKNFWKIKKNFKNIKTVFIQNGFRSIYSDIFSKTNQTERYKYHVDKMLVFNDEIGKKYSSHIEGETISIGSLNNNRISINKNQNQNQEILFISEWGPKRKWVGKTEEARKKFYPEKFIFPLLLDFAKKNNIFLNVLGRPYKKEFPDDNIEEKDFFSEIAGSKNWNYISTSKPGEESYNIIDNHKIIVCVGSTLGYEALARGKKTAFFSLRNLKITEETGYNFAWPSKLPDSGPFWTNIDNPLDVTRIMEFLLSINIKEWQETVEPYLPKCMKYDESNKRFLSEMNKLNIPIKAQ